MSQKSEQDEREKQEAEAEEARRREHESMEQTEARVHEEGIESAANGEEPGQWAKDHGFGDE